MPSVTSKFSCKKKKIKSNRYGPGYCCRTSMPFYTLQCNRYRYPLICQRNVPELFFANVYVDMSICYTCACYPRYPCSSAGHCSLSLSRSLSLSFFLSRGVPEGKYNRKVLMPIQGGSGRKTNREQSFGDTRRRQGDKRGHTALGPALQRCRPVAKCSIGSTENAQPLYNWRGKCVDAVESLLVNFKRRIS